RGLRSARSTRRPRRSSPACRRSSARSRGWCDDVRHRHADGAGGRAVRARGARPARGTSAQTRSGSRIPDPGSRPGSRARRGAAHRLAHPHRPARDLRPHLLRARRHDALQRLVRQRRPGHLLEEAVRRRPAEYHFILITSVLGMFVLASARELILLFVSFELMSIPLYVLTGFVKREDAAPEAALKFFLVGTASSAVIVYGISFIFGITGSTELAAIPGALSSGDSMMLLGMTLLLAGLGFKIAAFPFHMWAPDTYEAASTPFVA